MTAPGFPPAWFTAAIDDAPTQSVVDHQGTPIAMKTWGDDGGLGIVLVHGGAANSIWWDHIGPLLTSGGRRVAALDLAGHGESGRCASYSLDAWAAQVTAVITAAGFRRPPIVVGHSMGGFVAMRLAHTDPESMDAVVTIDSPVRDRNETEAAAHDRLAGAELKIYPTREAAVLRWRPIPDQYFLPYIRDHIAPRSLRETSDGFTWSYDPTVFSRPRHQPEDLLPNTKRVGLIRTEHGLVVRDGNAQVFESALASIGTVVEIPATGHHPMLDQPLALAAVLRSFTAVWS